MLGLPEESGRYKYVLIEQNDRIRIATGLIDSDDYAVALHFFPQKGLIKIMLGAEDLGIKSVGILDWDKENRNIVYHGKLNVPDEMPTNLRTPTEEEIHRLHESIGDSSLKYQTPLDELVG